LTDQNQTQHNSLRSGELLIGRNSSSADQRGPAHKGSTYKVSVSFFLFFFIFYYYLFCSFLVTAPSKNGWTDFDDLYVKRRGLAEGSAFWGSQRFQKYPSGSFSPKTPQIWGGNSDFQLKQNR
jgi:hypothetical protein